MGTSVPPDKKQRIERCPNYKERPSLEVFLSERDQKRESGEITSADLNSSSRVCIPQAKPGPPNTPPDLEIGPSSSSFLPPSLTGYRLGEVHLILQKNKVANL